MVDDLRVVNWLCSNGWQISDRKKNPWREVPVGINDKMTLSLFPSTEGVSFSIAYKGGKVYFSKNQYETWEEASMACLRISELLANKMMINGQSFR